MKTLFFSEPGIGSRKKTAVKLARDVISEAGGLHVLYGDLRARLDLQRV